MALIDGVNDFGYVKTLVVADNPRGAQQNTYPGLNGIEELDQGHRGRFLTITGRLFGASAAALSAAEETLRSYNDGLTHTIVDQAGTTWIFAKMENFEPQGKIEVSPDLYGSGPVCTRSYTARFKLLV
jgi:hypothetical protein